VHRRAFSDRGAGIVLSQNVFISLKPYFVQEKHDYTYMNLELNPNYLKEIFSFAILWMQKTNKIISHLFKLKLKLNLSSIIKIIWIFLSLVKNSKINEI
jgi:hypothetical protein